MNQHCTFFEELDLPDEVRQKIYRGNAEKMYGLKRRSSLQVLGNKRAMTATPAPAVQ